MCKKTNIWSIFDHWRVYIGEQRKEAKTDKESQVLTYFSLSVSYWGQKLIKCDAKISKNKQKQISSLVSRNFLRDKVQLEYAMCLHSSLKLSCTSQQPLMLQNTAAIRPHFLVWAVFTKNVFCREPSTKLYCSIQVSAWQWLDFHEIFMVTDLFSVT